MKTTHLTSLTLTLAFGVALSFAQYEEQQPTQQQPQKPRPEGHHHPCGHRPPPPLHVALDANRDGKIDAQEIANASTALVQLDKNQDGELTFEELRPPRPEGRPDGHPHHDGAPDLEGDASRPPRPF